MHAGIDIAAARGTPVYAPFPATVELVARDRVGPGPFSGYGNAVVLRHQDGFRSFYAHLSAALVEEGAHVAPGAVIGTVGNTSNGKFRGMGVHLHMEVRRPRPGGGSPFPGAYGTYNVDPEAYLLERGVAFGARGRILVSRTACPLLDETELAAWTGSDEYGPPAPTAGLGNPLVEAGEYEPPLAPDPDLWLGQALTPRRVAFLAIGGLVAGGAALAVGLLSRRS